MCRGFHGSSVGKESACNAGDPGSIPGSGRSPGEMIGFPHQYSWASLVAQLVNNLPAIWETWVWSLGWEVPLEKGKATHSSILSWKIPWTIGRWGGISELCTDKCLRNILNFFLRALSGSNYCWGTPNTDLPLWFSGGWSQFRSVAQSCLTLCHRMDYTVHGFLQARILECVAFPFSQGSSQPRHQIQVSHIAGRFLISWATRKLQEYWSG